MKNNFKILCLSCILGALYTNTSFAKNDDFNAKLNNLQKQINELNLKLSKKETKGKEKAKKEQTPEKEKAKEENDKKE